MNTSKRLDLNHAMSTASSAWNGWVVARVLPKSTGNEETAATVSSITAMTSRHAIDPSDLSPEKGLHFHPYASGKKDGDRTTSQLSDSNAAVFIDTNSETTTLEVFLYPPRDSDAHSKLSAINILLERKSNELIQQTLNRMVLSLNKQIAKLTQFKGKKVKKLKQNQQQQQSCTINNGISMYKMTSDGELEQWNVQNKTNLQTWTEAVSSQISIRLELTNNITAIFNVDSCPPTVMAVKTFEDFAGFVYQDIPSVIEVESLFTTEVIVDWYVGNELVCSNSNSYTPQNAHIGQYVSVLITPIRNDMESGRGYEQAYRFQHQIQALLENTIVKLRQGDIWTDSHRRTKISRETPLRVLTYNTLADQNAYARTNQGKQISFYPYVDASILDRKRRIPLILHEIISYQADIICLQEVDHLMWLRIFRPVLESAGYQGYWSGKDAHGMAEGCALLWSLHRFETVSKDEMKKLNLNQLVLDASQRCDDPRWKSAGSIAQVFEDRPDLKDVVENKLGHILQMVSLPIRRDPSDINPSLPDRLLVANTHLFYHPLGAHIRLMQMHAICYQFDKLQAEKSNSYPMILCGDMNSSLRRAAGYLLLNRQVLPHHTQIREHFNTFEWKERSDSPNESDENGNQRMRIEHEEEGKTNADWKDFPPVELPPHFPTFLPGYPKEPDFTHYLDSFVGSLDHIFVSLSSEHHPFGLIPLQCAPMPSVVDVTEDVAMPSAKLPSDHVSLVADLAWTNSSCN